jgi:hypothetical protein
MSDNFLYLTGGLGNQLFQVAYAIFQSDKREVIVDTTLGNPRVSIDGEVELLHYQLPSNISVKNKKSYAHKFYSRIAKYLLRTYISGNPLQRKKLVKKSTQILGSLALSLYLRRLINARVSSDIGFDQKQHQILNSSFFIGYFQTYKWASEPRVFETLNQLSPIRMSSIAVELIESAKISQPIILHVRLGDYLVESDFGIPSTSYYMKALKVLLKNNIGRDIWVFSDEIDKAKLHLPDVFFDYYKWIYEPSLTSAETLEIMKYGKDYVIANSTFSWWGAFLRKNRDARVIAPSPWFEDGPTPSGLIPPLWQLIDAFTRDTK